ncbi:MAG: glutamate-5-semialdehyde dehydrogenase [Tannerella sp.]|jgi:glutamate-5-semialdehyde dehydrogenase|nr:glutamate-5-semialdehyde dehydrogenase [Tannerella sp.]
MDNKNKIIIASQSAKYLRIIDDDRTNKVLNDLANLLCRNTISILDANKRDLSKMSLDNPKYDRLKLTEERIKSMAEDVRNITKSPSPAGIELGYYVRPNGMRIRKISVPFGTLGIIYEARPNVTIDVFSLCLKSGNVCVLKGGSDAENSNEALVEIIHTALKNNGVNESVCVLLDAGQESTADLLQAVGYIDVIIPRGSSSLIRFVRENSKVPVIETGAGICHTYFDKEGDKEKGREIIYNAKTRRVSVCNALDCLIVHNERLADLPYLCSKLSERNVVIYADEPAFESLNGKYPDVLLKSATAESFGTEFLDYIMSVKTVADINEALDHIGKYGSKHSECIVSESDEMIKLFENQIDAACVYANVSTAFTDGAQFGFGAEIGISTQKLHARGPMALRELTTYKYIIEGEGQVRP